MIRLPHILIHAPRIARLWGHGGWTLLFWTFASTRRVGLRFMRHEYRHVAHWVVGTALGLALMATLALLGWASWWLLPLGLLLFPLVYWLSFIPGGYHASWFERDAERYADGAE